MDHPAGEGGPREREFVPRGDDRHRRAAPDDEPGAARGGREPDDRGGDADPGRQETIPRPLFFPREAHVVAGRDAPQHGDGPALGSAVLLHDHGPGPAVEAGAGVDANGAVRGDRAPRAGADRHLAAE